MRRTESRPSSGERSDTPPGGEGNGGEGRESFSANAQHGGAAASSNAIADLANALRQALQINNQGGPTGHTGTYTSRTIEIRQKIEMLGLECLRAGKVLHLLSEFFEVLFFPGFRLKR